MKNIAFFPLFALLLCIAGCSQTAKQNSEGFKVYQVDLGKKTNPFGEVFSKAEIIPLETTDSSLIVWMNRVFPIDGKFYIHDIWTHKLFVYNKEGKFQHQVSRYGKGANEYISLYDCVMDEENDDIYMLSIFGRIKKFSKDGICKQNMELPPRPHYYSMELLGDKYAALWSCLEPEEGGVLVIDRFTGDTIVSDWHDDRVFDNQCHKPFHCYNGKVFFGTALRRQIYEVTTSGLVPAYLWDFGKDNIRDGQLEYYLNIETSGERNNKVIDDIGTEFLPSYMHSNFQNSQYAYVSLRLERGMRPALTHVFYDKSSGKPFVFDMLDGENCKMNNPLYFGEDYLLTDVLYENRETYKSILPESEYKKLEAMLEDDNPCLLKLYFKK